MKPWIAALMVALAGPAIAQHPQPYADLQHRTVKALSDQQMSDLRTGRGMGLALSAELNGYPGPLHVIELADRLQLTSDQRAQVQWLYDAMKAEAISVGEKLITQEAALDRLFAERIVSTRSLARLTAQIGETQGQLRTVHLKYHLTTAELLTADQRQRYAELRGYR